MPRWKYYDHDYLQSLIKTRPGETKVGEVIRAGMAFSEETRIVILGIPEDIGIRANLGTGGASTAWHAFLSAFLNIQSTDSLSGSHCCILGHLDCNDLRPISSSDSVDQLRQAVHVIDQEVASMIEFITAAGKLPIVIGGGHNNAYPIIKGAAKGYCTLGSIKAASLNVINLDAHADFRSVEGRHSGNGFRYAFQEGFLDRYAIIGLHRNYNAQNIINEIAREERILYTFWEEIFLEEKIQFNEALEQAIQFTDSGLCGIELDLDCVENTLSSAMTPSGVSPTQARQYVYHCAQKADPAYLHLCEGAVKLENGLVDPTTGKLMAYLISDFIRALISKIS